MYYNAWWYEMVKFTNLVCCSTRIQWKCIQWLVHYSVLYFSWESIHDFRVRSINSIERKFFAGYQHSIHCIQFIHLVVFRIFCCWKKYDVLPAFLVGSRGGGGGGVDSNEVSRRFLRELWTSLDCPHKEKRDRIMTAEFIEPDAEGGIPTIGLPMQQHCIH